ncbi:MAG: S8 family serine peptidase [Candidatus Eisenbacteria bacterium]
MRATVVSLCLALLLAGATRVFAASQPFIWDQDGDGNDDRIESVYLFGYAASYESSDTTRRQRIEVKRTPGGLAFGVYVLWDHLPTESDMLALSLLGMPTLSRIEAIPATRSLASFAQIEAAAALPGVERVEAVPVLYPELRDAAATVGLRDPSGQVFPTWAGALPAAQGHGVVVAFLDTGINDAPDGAYPGHQSLLGRCLGGGSFIGPDSISHTPRSASVNPVDRGGEASKAHGTHVAAIAVGSGGDGGYARGVAPQARFIDVKVLDDSGHGVAVAEAIDWCISNRSRAWAGSAPDEHGIDVINMSLSSPDQSDGQDLASRLASRATELGIVVVASVGNDGLSSHVPSPAGGDGVLVVGAWDTRRSPASGDDAWPSFNNSGPRASDGDVNGRDECKPDLLAPGVDILSADGDLASDGTAWRRLSGTSMAAAFVTGAAALLIESAPSLGPTGIAERLRASAQRPLAGSPTGTPGADPRWRSSRGCGLLDIHAALLEITQPTRSQVRRLTFGATSTTVLATLSMGRELGAGFFVFERASDLAGAPGGFAPFDSVIAAGDSSLADDTSVTDYSRAWLVPMPEAGQVYWYRVAYTEGGVRWVTRARRFTNPGGPSAATVGATIVHNAYDSDIEAVLRIGGPGGGGPEIVLPGTSGAVASDWYNGSSATGNQAWIFQIEIPAGTADGYLPPDAAHPWTLHVSDAGSPIRSGRIADFRVVWHSGGGDQVFVGGSVPRQTVDGATVTVVVPQSTLDVGLTTVFPGLRLGPNPVRPGGSVRFASSRAVKGRVRVLDLLGREVASVTLSPEGSGWSANWSARDAHGRDLSPGVYLARLGDGLATRLVVIGR